MPVYKNLEYVRIVHPLPKYVERDIFGIPFVEADSIDISNMNNGKWLINLDHAGNKDENAYRKIVHGFSKDEVLMRQYNNPYRFLRKVGRYYAVATLDFSMDDKFTAAQVIDVTFRNRWSGAFLQANGKMVIPTVGWTTAEYFDITFSGLRNGSTFIISTLGTHSVNNGQEFLAGYHELRSRFPDSKLICVGNAFPGMDSDVCYIPFEDSFGSWDRYQDYWQPALFNWDCSVSKVAGGV